jgi:hypothetical protein
MYYIPLLGHYISPIFNSLKSNIIILNYQALIKIAQYLITTNLPERKREKLIEP